MLLSRHQTHTQSHRYPDPHFFSFEFDFPALSKKKKPNFPLEKYNSTEVQEEKRQAMSD